MVTPSHVHYMATVFRIRKKNLTTFPLNFCHRNYIMVTYLIIHRTEGESRHLNVFYDFVKAYLLVIVEAVLVAEHLNVDMLVEVR